MNSRLQTLAKTLFGLVLCVGIWVAGPGVAYGFDNPELLPQNQTPIIDLAKALTKTQANNLEQKLNDFENDTGWKLRVLTQQDKTPGRAVKDYWNLDEKGADSRNLIHAKFLNSWLVKICPRENLST